MGNFCTDIFQAGSKVVLKTSTYPNKRNVAYGTIRSTDPRTKACGIELGAEFGLVRIDQSLLDNEELVREVSDCKTIGEAFSSGYLIAWPSTFIREKDN
uniref:Transposase Tnp1/En/Spm-like domain-containing protein n=1 Tax=Hordeum vulgare subsp. vulgare TaxID=112509 RepID=A0A8I6Y3H2_HORVV